MLEVHDPVKVADTNTSDPNWPKYDGRDPTNGGIGPSIVQIGDTPTGYPPVITGINQTDMQTGMAAWWANYEAFAQAANCPIFLAEGNWDPVVNNPGPGGAAGIAYITDKLALWGGLTPVPCMQSIWEYDIDQTGAPNMEFVPDPFAMRPGNGPGVLGAAPDGWTAYADAFLNNTATIYRVTQSGGSWHRRK
jgi:hypothetical protein